MAFLGTTRTAAIDEDSTAYRRRKSAQLFTVSGDSKACRKTSVWEIWEGPGEQRSNCWCNGTHQLLKKYWKRKFSLIRTLQWLQHRNQSKINYIALRKSKTKPKSRLPCQHQQVEETLWKYPFPHKSVPQHPPFHYCHSIPSWRTQLLPSQNSGLPHWFLEE